MTEDEAKESAQVFRNCGWNVCAQRSPMACIGWELIGVAVDGGRDAVAFSHEHMKALALSGQVASLKPIG